MGYSKNYIMYWGGFYRYYNSMDVSKSLHKVHKSYRCILCKMYSTFFLYLEGTVKICTKDAPIFVLLFEINCFQPQTTPQTHRV